MHELVARATRKTLSGETPEWLTADKTEAQAEDIRPTEHVLLFAYDVLMTAIAVGHHVTEFVYGYFAGVGIG